MHVVVVAYRSAALIAACLRPLLADPGVAHVVVVDNSSDPATEQVCRELVDQAGRLRYETMPNVGYARAVNAGAARRGAGTTHVAVLNPDVALTRPLSELVRRTSGLPLTIVSGLLDQGGGCLNVRPMASLRRELLTAVVGSRAYRVTEVRGERGTLHQVPQIDGSLMVLPVDEFNALGGLDERFELYFEDVDLCRRANARLGCWVVTEVLGEPPRWRILRRRRCRPVRRAASQPYEVPPQVVRPGRRPGGARVRRARARGPVARPHQPSGGPPGRLRGPARGAGPTGAPSVPGGPRGRRGDPTCVPAAAASAGESPPKAPWPARGARYCRSEQRATGDVLARGAPPPHDLVRESAWESATTWTCSDASRDPLS